jgi:hypothetical protein
VFQVELNMHRNCIISLINYRIVHPEKGHAKRQCVCGFASSSATTLDNSAAQLKRSLWVVAEGIPLLLLCTKKVRRGFICLKEKAKTLTLLLGFATLVVTHHQSRKDTGGRKVCHRKLCCQEVNII